MGAVASDQAVETRETSSSTVGKGGERAEAKDSETPRTLRSIPLQRKVLISG